MDNGDQKKQMAKEEEGEVNIENLDLVNNETDCLMVQLSSIVHLIYRW